ncbi:MAG: FAD:protein FMN transferase [Lachnospiraceae bacterium]|nr:FAD:protein FMN transferase [Lachnospiraceae bacterium]
MDQTQKAVNHSGTAMGTMVSMTVYPLDKTDQDDAKALIDTVMAEVERLEKECLSRRVETAEIFQLNENAGNDQGMSVSPFLESVLEESLKLSQESDGAFDISVGALSVLWNIDAISAGEGDANIPAKAQIAEAMARCGYEKLTLQGGKAYLKKGTILDLGSIGKGLALDQIRELLDARAKDDGVDIAGVFSMGGSVLTYGDKPNGKPWNIAIIDPADPSKTLGTLALKGGLCVSTSGDYERYFEQDGMRYHHILDPSTGYPVGNGIHGVTIVSESGFLSDALSTACFVLGPEKGMELAERHHAAILMAGDQGQIWMNDAMKSIYSPSK